MQRIKRQFSVWLLLLVATLGVQAAQAQELPDFTELVKQAAPGVVNISTTRQVERRSMPFSGPQGQEIPEIFRHFFGDQIPFGQGGIPGGSEERHSLGSGFIIDKDGYILTNAHVVDGADEVVVRLNDRRELNAEVVGSDAKTDVALLKVDANNLPTLNIGDSNQLEVGEWVAAIGSPFGFDHSVTSGIVSAIDRTLPSDAYVPFIQTDVAINPGNSGGPLFNLDGEVVGINSQIFTRSGGFMGLSFAIPINVAMDIADQLRSEGRVSRGWLGVVIQPVSRDLAESFGLDGAKGALIAEVAPNTPAADAGLKAGDIILSVNGEEVDSSTTLPRLIGRVNPGEEADLAVLRNGERVEKTVTVGDWPEEARAGASGDARDPQSRLGISVAPLEQEQLERLELDSGVRVVQVDPAGAAAKAGVRAGDIIVSLDQQDIASPEQLAEVISQVEGNRAVPLRLYRDGRSLFVALRLGQAE
ncbi:DegQ family serine endoprotease [Halomonas sp. McH1-25]|uniref:DegQ family serine endoprotease n=1 Tax=unclassified Halomonas TaxID=2609666 RepID=UPI001EF63EE9|nr:MULTISPECIES: DegQ family serine endoprotease [unclassified Halomonas]MCG7598178.1 DegQ family serine endoprotease [Halomonas sp. McH1-25]MCP1341039.1 DegQ family serine endoprotease [Halomonas sp. FL8]MCP1360898.1 DegQ family serine endoprotease [Halomonas sp. BBD45]MCP1366814.1 DegQ family serine endoprotease [Halomonas sp. BBD48]